MTKAERQKAISTAMAHVGMSMLPPAVRSGIAALAEEVRDQDERLAALNSALGHVRAALDHRITNLEKDLNE